MRPTRILMIMVAVAIASVGVTRAIEAATELAKINGQVLTLEEFNKRYAENLRFFQPTPPTRIGVLDDLIKRDLAVQEAKREGLENDPEVRDQIDTVLYHALIAKNLSKDFEKIYVTDDEAKAFYSRNPEIRTSQIFVAAPATATSAEDARARAHIQQIYDKYVRPGEMSFAEIAQKYSDGPAAPMGGDIDYQTKDKLHPTYYQAALKLKVGQVSGIVRSQFGYHIIKLTGTRSWDETDHGLVKRLVIEQRRDQIFNNYMKRLRAQARVTTHPELLRD